MCVCAAASCVDGNGEVGMDPSKFEVIHKLAPPKTKKDVRSFFEISGYY